MQDLVRGVALTILIFSISVYVPIFGFFFALFIPLPILFFRAKSGRSQAMVIAVVVIASMMTILGGVGFDILFFIGLVALGYFLGDLFDRHFSIEKTVLYTCGSVLTIAAAGIVFFSAATHTGVISMVTAYVSRNLEMTLSLYEAMGVSEETIHMIASSLDRIGYVLVRMLPCFAVVGTLLTTWANLLAARPIFLAKGLAFPDFGPLNMWKAPEFLVWVAIGSGLLLMVPSLTAKIVGMNVLSVMLTIYFFQGIAIVSFFFDRKKFPRWIRFFLYSLVALQQIVLLVVIGLGFFDIWMNFRKTGLNSA